MRRSIIYKIKLICLILIQIMLEAEQQQKIISALLRRKENSVCADCNGKSPCWASLDFGVFVCLNCSGGHRALGPSVTRVKSTKLDTWNREWLQNMQLGNSVLNQYWEHQLTGTNCSLKPNVNTSLHDIIKYVREKYLKKRYANQQEELDPLQRQKQQPLTSTKSKPKEQIIVNISKELPKPSLKQIQSTQLQKNVVNNPQKQTGESPFAAFDRIASDKKIKPQPQNLISFEQSEQKKKEKNNFAFFDFELKETKYVKSQFKTTNAKPSTSSPPFDFESLLKQKEVPLTQTNHAQHQNYFINSGTNQNEGFSMSQHISHSLPQNDKNQYSTMNINMNMYPKVVNINMNHTHYGYDPFSTNAHYAHLSYSQQPINLGMHQTAGFAKHQNLYTPTVAKQASTIKNITLQPTINLAGTTKPKQAEQPSSSWVDDWK